MVLYNYLFLAKRNVHVDSVKVKQIFIINDFIFVSSYIFRRDPKFKSLYVLQRQPFRTV